VPIRFEALVQRARQDDDVVGLVLGGSRGKGAHVDERSDYDVYVVLRDEQAVARWAGEFPTRHGDPVEVLPMSLASFREHGAPGSATAWNAYTFAHVEPLVDKLGGEIAALAAAKAVVDPATAAAPLDDYVNSYYRSAKNARLGLVVEAHLDAAESVSPFLAFLFAAFGRVRPFNKWLRWELERHPLEPPWTADELLPRLERIVATGSIAHQQALFRDAERLARSRGLGAVVDGWEPDVAWLRGEGGDRRA
jgi:hypothetical protein